MGQIHVRLQLSALFLAISLQNTILSVKATEPCEKWITKAVSVQGNVQAQRAGETACLAARMNDTFCPGDMIRTQERRGPAIILPNEVKP